MPTATINGMKLNYEETGKGFPVFFAHGMTGSLHDWDSQFQALAPKYRVIAWDCLGHGKSEAPSSESGYSIHIFAECVYGLLKHLGIKKCCLAGHSMGGFTALQLALDHPEIVAALVLVDTSSGEFERVPGYDQIRVKLDELARTQGLEAAFEYNVTHNPQMQERFSKHPELREISRQKTVRTSVNGFIYVPRSFAQWKSVTPRLSEIRVPTLIFRGEEDTNFIKACETLKNGIRNSGLVVVPGVGHNPHEEAPRTFNQALTDFLGKSVKD